MSDPQTPKRRDDSLEPTPGQQPEMDGTSSPRLPNIRKLSLVPPFALRQLLEMRAPGRELGHLNQAKLLTEIDRLPAIIPTDVEGLYENYRYGQRLSFYLYLLPGGICARSLEEIQGFLDKVTKAERTGVSNRTFTDDGFESETTPKQLVLLDEDFFDDIREIRFRYYVGHHYLNAQEQPDHILQTRYGFLWLDLNLGYLVLISDDEWVNRRLTQALSTCLRALPVPVRFPKELVDKHLSIEKVKRVSHYDPGTGVRQSISGQGLWKTSEQEILAREQHHVRPSTLYEEEVADGVISGLGVAASKGKIYLTRALPTSLVRAWAMHRLPDLVRDLKHLRESQPDSFTHPIEAINRLRLRKAGKTALVTIVEALLQTDREELTSLSLPQTAMEIYDALAGKYFSPYLRTECSQCEEMAELCPQCESPDLDLKGRDMTCKACGTSLSEGECVALRCLNGHVTTPDRQEAWSIAPNHWLQKRMLRIFEEIGQPWDAQADYFHIEGSTLYRLRRGGTPCDQLPPVVQAYINNFWDPVNGTVHAGTGDIIVNRSASQTAQEPEEQPASPAGRAYRSMDLRLRGNPTTGYTVEADADGGGSVSPQPLVLPPGRAFQYRLDRILRRVTTDGEMQQVGKSLFNALFPTRVLKLWSRTVGSLDEGEGLRLRLNIGPPELMVLPWELAFEDEYVGLRLRFPIVRYLALPDPPKPLGVQPPLRVLVALSQPVDLLPFDVAQELASISQAADQLPGQIEVDVLETAQREELLARLRQDYHVLHYVGHGMFDGDEGYLVFEDKEGRSDPVSALLLGQIVSDSSLRLAVLNACETSTTSRDGDLGGVAHRLVEGGVPAVVAMQAAIPDRSAVAFSRGFYGSLVNGWPVDAAVQEGRRAIMTSLGSDWTGFFDWAIPTLYMRAPDGVILEIHAGNGNTAVEA